MGRTLRGPVESPVLLCSFAEFQRVFGGLWQPSPLGYAIEQFFDNGGREACVVRVVNGAHACTLCLPAGAGALTLRARRPGTREFLRAAVDYDNVAPDAEEFNLTVQRLRASGTEQVEDQEIYPKLSVRRESGRFIGGALDASALVTVIGAVPARRPDRTLDAVSGLATGYVRSNPDGDDGAALTDYDVIGSQTARTGLFALDGLDWFNFLCIPPLSRDRDVAPGLLLIASRYCRRRLALLIVDPPAGWQTADDALTGLRDWHFASDSAVMYFPRILAYDKLRGSVEVFAPCGAVAGMLARADETMPLWGASRFEEAVLRPGCRPACLITEERRRRLASRGVNTLQAVRSAARIGVEPRTLCAGHAGAPEWRFLASRRLVLFILRSIERGTRWMFDAPPQPDAAAVVAEDIRRFFGRLHEAGAFGSRPPEEAFRVLCGAPTDPRNPAGLDIVIAIGAARRLEFHGFRIEHSAAGGVVSAVDLRRFGDGGGAAEAGPA